MLPKGLSPMLATTAALPLEDGWAYEVKWDGVRALVAVEDGHVRATSRRGNDVTAAYPELQQINCPTALLDGEVVALVDGIPDFGALQARMHVRSPSAALIASVPVTFVPFDLLHLQDHALLYLPYDDRRALLEALPLEVPPTFHGDGEQLLESTRQQGLEGLLAKRRDSTYQPGRRSDLWRKTKHLRRQSAVVCGWQPGEGGRTGQIGSLLLGVHGPDGLVYAGKVGTGFSAATLHRLGQLLHPLTRPTPPYDGPVPPTEARLARWVEPVLVVDVELTAWTRDGRLRHPSYKGLRDDLDRRRWSVSRELRTMSKVVVDVEGRQLTLSNLEKVLYPDGFTKGQVLDYVSRIAPVLLPHLRDRPLTMKRWPNGTQGHSFFEKNAPSHRPDWLRTETLPSPGSARETIDYLVIDDLASLVWVTNLASLELHVPQWRVGSDGPDLLVFDLDPGPPATAVECCEVALLLRELLTADGVESFAKTSGNKGLQLCARAPGPDTSGYAKDLAQQLEARRPDLIVSKMAKNLRPGKVLVDWSQNNPAKTTICAYSLRANDHPTVSTPISWDEVAACTRPEDLVLTSDDVLERVQQGDLLAPLL